jgi:hypothetical protein
MCNPFTNVCCLFCVINLFNTPNEQASVWLVHLTPSPYNSLGFHDNLLTMNKVIQTKMDLKFL